jgi:hypothetical protein
VLPVSGVPDIEVSSNMAFDRLRGFTDPQYNLEVELEGECMEEQFFPEAQFDGAANVGAPSAADAGAGVMVLDEGSVGPYDYTVISVDPMLDDAAQVAIDWLNDNDYDLMGIGPDVLRPYLEENLNLLAFRLTKGNMTGAIRPVVLTYAGSKPSIPIRPTAVAAENDMGVRVWVLSDAQAVPSNYKSLVINEALINWFNYRQNYDQVITAAADEAGGQGFVTEMAGDSTQLDEIVFNSNDMQQWMSYQLQNFEDGFQAIQEASWRYRFWDGWRKTVCDAVNLPSDVTCDDFGRNPDAYRGVIEIDENAFIQALFENVVKPVIDTQEILLSRPYMTRLYSTMSADEMTLDPAFDFNPDLADVSNVHTAKQIIECSPELLPWQAPYRIELPQGGVIRGEGNQQWPIAIDDLPANLRIVQLSTAGAGEIVEDNRDMVLDALFEQSGVTASGTVTLEMPDEGVPIGGPMEPAVGNGGGDTMGPADTQPPEANAGAAGAGDGGSDGDGGGVCSVGRPGGARGDASATALLGALALGLAVRRRRRLG